VRQPPSFWTDNRSTPAITSRLANVWRLQFNVGGTRLKAKYNHRTGPRGGIQILEVLPGRGSPEGRTVVSITNLREAAKIYRRAPGIFRRFLASRNGSLQKLSA
jgi:hypothetical protein